LVVTLPADHAIRTPRRRRRESSGAAPSAGSDGVRFEVLQPTVDHYDAG
jgi:hypothetical protein